MENLQFSLKTDRHYKSFSHEVNDWIEQGRLDVFMSDWFKNDYSTDVFWVIGFEYYPDGTPGRSADIFVLTRDGARSMNE
jgi:hypothetical protein